MNINIKSFYLALIILTVVSFTADAQQNKDSGLVKVWEQNKAKKLKTVKVQDYNMKELLWEGSIFPPTELLLDDKHLTSWTSKSYDVHGRQTERIYQGYYGDSIYEHTITKWDEEGGIEEGMIKGYYMAAYQVSYKYDRKGRAIEEKKFGSGVAFYYWSYKFDNRDNRIEYSGYDSLGNVTSKTIYEHDSRDYIVKLTYYYKPEPGIDADVEITVYKYKLDARGNLLKWTIYRNGKIQNKYGYQYDEKCNKQSEYLYYYYPDGKKEKSEVLKLTYKYDENCRVTEEKAYVRYPNFPDFAYYSMYSYKYDSKGNMLERISYDSEGKETFSDLSKYDEKGNVLEEIRKTGDEVDWRHIYKYDSNGNMLESMDRYTYGNTTYTRYTYWFWE